MNFLRNLSTNLRTNAVKSMRTYSTQPRISLANLINSGSKPNSQDPLTGTRALTPEEIWAQAHQQRMRTLAQEQPLSLYAGRTVVVGKYDKNSATSQVERAWKRLNGTLARNEVRRDLMLRDRYERPHQMRRRLKSERHRRRFAEYIRQKVSLVHSIRRRNEMLKK
ncbi:hypothetical protein E3Q23_02151 [Wallemia mellicola]|uniref:Ribosomal protein S21 n=1 Tax=Wallemia mellicola TaxID=1708541 RepID=A0A4T0PQ88_9BASI|nr:hypothetical protein E3Q23_02151 [Wallemia mellicola]TIC12368.1 hypothetical protein E3Q14_01838 [Wallemia mellicola]TIC31445.1 hypothetical protein E3Q10_01652 [Wallemia mellicola]TIC66373.1 hypothetical protein E3Q01_01773 [Wallemia mellicola]